MSAPAPPVVLRWTPTRADLDDALAVYRRTMGPRVLIFTYFPAFALLLLAAALILVDQPLFAAVTAAGAAVFAVFANRINNRAVWRNPLVRQPAEAVVGPDALRMSSPTATTEWKWVSFSRAVETPRSFVLLGRPFAGPGKRNLMFCYLPKAALAHPAEADRLRALLGHTLPGGVGPR
ncbi:MAG TPA: YcxB family protein [Mycobacteriales bacterium]|nr:YcxB family protein [Mycobacteriales bacterium]